MNTAAIQPIRLPMRAPDDLEGFARLLDSTVPAGDVVALWCKTRGNGLRNDFTKPWIDLLLRTHLAKRLGVDEQAVAERVPILVSGGSEGVVSPHLVVWAKGRAGRRGLVACVARTTVAEADQGTPAHQAATRKQLDETMAAAGLAPADVGLVLVRAPARPDVAGNDAAVRSAAALGVARALDGERATFASRAFVVARHDGPGQQIFVLANGPGGNPDFAVVHAVLGDPLDAPAAAAALAALGLVAAPQLSRVDSERVIATIAKGDAPADGTLRGLPHAMSLDNDVAMHRHARAAFGGMLATLLGHGAVLVSGGAESQGPPDGGFASFVALTAKEAS